MDKTAVWATVDGLKSGDVLCVEFQRPNDEGGLDPQEIWDKAIVVRASNPAGTGEFRYATIKKSATCKKKSTLFPQDGGYGTLSVKYKAITKVSTKKRLELTPTREDEKTEQAKEEEEAESSDSGSEAPERRPTSRIDRETVKDVAKWRNITTQNELFQAEQILKEEFEDKHAHIADRRMTRRLIDATVGLMEMCGRAPAMFNVEATTRTATLLLDGLFLQRKKAEGTPGRTLDMYHRGLEGASNPRHLKDLEQLVAQQVRAGGEYRAPKASRSQKKE